MVDISIKQIVDYLWGLHIAGTSVFANSLNIRDGYLSVYDPGLYGYGLVINGYSMVKTNSSHDCIVIADFNLAQDGYLYARNGFVVTSSEKIKSNIRDIEQSDLIHNISFKRYSKLHSLDNGTTYIVDNDMGVIAEDIQTLDPTNNFKLVLEKDDKVFVDYSKLFLLGLVQVQKLRKDLDATNVAILQLQNENTDLKNSISRLLPLLDHPIFKQK